MSFLLRFLSLLCLFLLLTPPAFATPTLAELEALIISNHEAHQTSMNHMWTMIAAALVFFMQGGFLLLEAGMSRSKNSINVAQKNIVDFFIAVIFFYAIGFMFMFGTSVGGWIGWEGALAFMSTGDDWYYTFFIFQAVFAGTAGTIVSGAIAERTSFAGYVVITVLIAAIIYPIAGHWMWGNLLNADNTSYLMNEGFIDFAGSTVVHSVGAWVALAACLVVGPRLGRFDENGKPKRMAGHSLVLSTLGCIILWVGWIGFNGGSTTTGDSSFAHIIFNTMLAAVFGGGVALFLGRWKDGYFSPDHSINGVLGGLVAITAGCDVVTGYGAVFLGMGAGAVMFFATQFLINVLKVDDVVGAIPVHGFCGAWGTLMLALVMPEENLAAASRLEQLSIQAQGVIMAFVWAFGVAYAGCYIINKTVGLRVSEKHEIEGLNVSEHKATLGTGILQQRMRDVVDGERDLTKRINIENGDEAAEVAGYMNIFLDHMQQLMRDIDKEAGDLAKHSDEITHISTILASSSEEVCAQSSNVEKFNTQVTDDIHGISKNADHMSQTVQHISRSASDISANMQQVGEVIHMLRDSIQDVANKSQNANGVTVRAQELSGSAFTSMQTLTEAATHIGDVITMIENIAKQTNMLALNASIEATRAGDASQGFTVVAEEVKNLAVETTKATDDIRKRIVNIQNNSSDVASSIAEMADILNTVTASISNISHLTDEQNRNAGEISERFGHASSEVTDISDKIVAMAGSAKEVSDKASSTAINAAEIQRNMRAFTVEAGHTSGNAQSTHKISSDIHSASQRLGQAVKHYKI